MARVGWSDAQLGWRCWDCGLFLSSFNSRPSHECKDIDLPESKVTAAAAVDPINNPAHYNIGGIEAIDVIEAWELNFRLANAVKYIARADHKGKPLEDLKKARWYLDREISKREVK